MDYDKKISFIKTNTNFTEDEIKQKMNETDNNVEKIVRDYFYSCTTTIIRNELQDVRVKSNNQQKYSVIRNMLDK
jgi:hypothetical protein